MSILNRAPCESCPCGCAKCAWDQSTVVLPPDHSFIVRTKEEYGCAQEASVVVDTIRNIPLMELGGNYYPLSTEFGGILKGTRLEEDIGKAVARA